MTKLEIDTLSEIREIAERLSALLNGIENPALCKKISFLARTAVTSAIDGFKSIQDSKEIIQLIKDGKLKDLIPLSKPGIIEFYDSNFVDTSNAKICFSDGFFSLQEIHVPGRVVRTPSEKLTPEGLINWIEEYSGNPDNFVVLRIPQ